MRRIYLKTGSLVVMACLSLLTVGVISSGNVMASQRLHSHSFVHKPHIILKVLPNTTQYINHNYVARAIIYGVGFNGCGNCGSDQSDNNPCDSGCSAPAPSDTPSSPCDSGCGAPAPSDTPSSPCDSGCGAPAPSDTPSPCEAGCTTSHQDVTDRVTTTDVQTTTTTTTTTNVSHHSIGCNANCIPAAPATVPCNPCSSNNSRNNNTAPNNYNSSPNNSYNTAPNATCPSYNDCGTGSNNSGAGPNDSSANNGGCDCSDNNTANLQGNVPFTAPGINVSRIPVNTFGEFALASIFVSPGDTTAPVLLSGQLTPIVDNALIPLPCPAAPLLSAVSRQ